MAPVAQYLKLFSAVSQSRLECLLGDYTSSLDALKPIYDSNASPIPLSRGADDDSKPLTPSETIDSLFSVKVNVAYHMGVCYLMLRRYRDASRVLGEVCATMQRGFKSGEYRNKNVPGSEQFVKLYDRMVALLAIITHACPETGLIDAYDSIGRVIREKHGRQLSKIEAGEEGYEDLFMYACPKFVTPSVPRYELLAEGGAGNDGNVGSLGPTNQDAYKLQVAHFMNEMAVQQTLRKLRSYMKLYTSISLEKLGRLVMEEDFVPLLLAYKHKMRQIECSRSGDDGVGSSGSDSGATTESVGTVMDIHYFINDGIIHVDEAEKLHRFENYFMSQISQSIDVMTDINSISVNI